MGFRQNNHEKRLQHDAYSAWRDSVSIDIATTSLPPTVFASRDDWQYFVDYSYHDTGNYRTPPFTHIDATSDNLAPDQLAAVQRLRRSWDDECARIPILNTLL